MAEDGRILVTATVIDIGDGPVIYPACQQCYSKLSASRCNTNQSHCHKCREEYDQDEIEYRFRLSLSVTDNSTITNVTAFGGMLKSFFGVSATSFHHKCEHPLRVKFGAAYDSILKTALEQTFVGQTLIFGLKVPVATLKLIKLKQLRNQMCVTIKDICSSESVASQLSQKSELHPLSGLIATQVLQQKDSMISVTVANNLEFIDKAIEQHGLTPNDCFSDRTNLQRLFFNGADDRKTPDDIQNQNQSYNKSIKSFQESSLYHHSRTRLSSIGFSCDSSIEQTPRVEEKSVVGKENCTPHNQASLTWCRRSYMRKKSRRQGREMSESYLTHSQKCTTQDNNVQKAEVLHFRRNANATYLNSVKGDNSSPIPGAVRAQNDNNQDKSFGNIGMFPSPASGSSECKKSLKHRHFRRKRRTNLRRQFCSQQDLDKGINFFPPDDEKSSLHTKASLNNEPSIFSSSLESELISFSSDNKRYSQTNHLLADTPNVYKEKMAKYDDPMRDRKTSAEFDGEMLGEMPDSEDLELFLAAANNSEIIRALMHQNESLIICASESKISQKKEDFNAISRPDIRNPPPECKSLMSEEAQGTNVYAERLSNNISCFSEIEHSQQCDKIASTKLLSLKHNPRNRVTACDNNFEITDEYAANISANVTVRRSNRRKHLSKLFQSSESLCKSTVGDNTSHMALIPEDLLDAPESEDLWKFLKCISANESIPSTVQPLSVTTQNQPVKTTALPKALRSEAPPHVSEPISIQGENINVKQSSDNDIFLMKHYSVVQSGPCQKGDGKFKNNGDGNPCITENNSQEGLDKISLTPKAVNSEDFPESEGLWKYLRDIPANESLPSTVESSSVTTERQHVGCTILSETVCGETPAEANEMISLEGGNAVNQQSCSNNVLLMKHYSLVESDPCHREQSNFKNNTDKDPDVIKNISQEEPDIMTLSPKDVNSEDLFMNENVTDCAVQHIHSSSHVPPEDKDIKFQQKLLYSDTDEFIARIGATYSRNKHSTTTAGVPETESDFLYNAVGIGNKSQYPSIPCHLTSNCVYPSDSQLQDSCISSNSSQDLFDSQTDSFHLHKENQISEVLPRYMETNQPAFNGSSFLSNSSHYGRNLDDLRTQNATRRKVKFKKMRVEHHFYDFDIISHHPVVEQSTPPLKPCLKQTVVHDEVSGSQDLFSDISYGNHSSSVQPAKYEQFVDSSSQLFSQSPCPGPTKRVFNSRNENIKDCDRFINVYSATQDDCIREKNSKHMRNINDSKTSILTTASPIEPINEISFDLFSPPHPSLSSRKSPDKTPDVSSVGQSTECFTPDLFT